MLNNSTTSIIKCVDKLHSALVMDLNEILEVLLIKITDKESQEGEQTKSQLMQFLWHVCVPLHSI